MRIALLCLLLIAVLLWPAMLQGVWLVIDYFDKAQLSYLAILALIGPLAGQYFCSNGNQETLCGACTAVIFVAYFIYRFYAFADGSFGVLLLEVLRAFLVSRVALGVLFVIIPILFLFLYSVQSRINGVVQLRKKKREEEERRRREAADLAALPPEPSPLAHSQWVQAEMEKARLEHEDRLVAIRTSGLEGREAKLLEDRSAQQMLRILKELMESQTRPSDGGFQ